jgi:hypothetical protein
MARYQLPPISPIKLAMAPSPMNKATGWTMTIPSVATRIETAESPSAKSHRLLDT